MFSELFLRGAILQRSPVYRAEDGKHIADAVLKLVGERLLPPGCFSGSFAQFRYFTSGKGELGFQWLGQCGNRRLLLHRVLLIWLAQRTS